MSGQVEDDSFQVKLAGLAMKIADEASVDGVGLGNRIDAFKVLTTYFVSIKKINVTPDPDPDTGGADFVSFQRRISAASGSSG